jgi:hypothetical protein
MADGTGGVPGLPKIDMAGNSNVQTDVSSKNIFDLIKQSNTQSMTSALPYVQAQFDKQSANVAPQLEAIRRGGEVNAAAAVSDAGARGMRGSDIEAAGVGNARNTAQQSQAEMLSKLSVQQAETMAQYIMQAYGYDIQANSQMYNNLAQAIGQELSQQRDMQQFEEQLKLMKKQLKENSKSSVLGSLLNLAGTAGGAAIGGAFGGASGAALGAKIGGAAGGAASNL